MLSPTPLNHQVTRPAGPPQGVGTLVRAMAPFRGWLELILRWRATGWLVVVLALGAFACESGADDSSATGDGEPSNPASTADVVAVVDPGAASAVAVAALEAGVGDPLEVEMPPADFAETKAWLQGDGSPAVSMVTETATLWADEPPDCVAVAQRLEESGTPNEMLQAAVGTPDEVTAEILASLRTAVMVALSRCDPSASEVGLDQPETAEAAWQWTVAYRRLVRVGVIQ